MLIPAAVVGAMSRIGQLQKSDTLHYHAPGNMVRREANWGIPLSDPARISDDWFNSAQVGGRGSWGEVILGIRQSGGSNPDNVHDALGGKSMRASKVPLLGVRGVRMDCVLGTQSIVGRMVDLLIWSKSIVGGSGEKSFWGQFSVKNDEGLKSPSARGQGGPDGLRPRPPLF